MIQVFERMRVLIGRFLCAGGLCLATFSSVFAQWGLCITDMAANQFTAVRMMEGADNVSTVWRASYLAGRESMSSPELGWFYDSAGNWFNVSGDLDLRWQGVGLEFAYRKTYEPEQRPSNGFFAGIHGSLRHVVSTCSEVVMADELLPEDVYGSYGEAPAGHVMNTTMAGVGLELGWILEAEGRIGLEFFLAPIFQGVARSYRQVDSNWSSDEELDGALVNRFNVAYAPKPIARGMYLRQTGPWLRFGTVLYLKSKPALSN